MASGEYNTNFEQDKASGVNRSSTTNSEEMSENFTNVIIHSDENQIAEINNYFGISSSAQHKKVKTIFHEHNTYILKGKKKKFI